MKKSNNENDKEEPADFIESITIKDPKIIEECDKKTPRIPEDETEESFDRPYLKKNSLKKSEQIIGQILAMLIAFCPSNPEIDGLIISGRHRFLQNPKWKKQYVRINNWQEYYKLRFHLNIHKRRNSAETKKIIQKCGEELIKQGIAPEKIASILWKDFPGISRATFLKIIDPKWKNSQMAKNRLGKKDKTKKNIHEKCQQEVESLKAQNQRLKNDNAEITESTQKTLRDNALQSGNDSSRLKILEAGQVVEVKGLKFMIKVEKGGTNFDVEESN